MGGRKVIVNAASALALITMAFVPTLWKVSIPGASASYSWGLTYAMLGVIGLLCVVKGAVRSWCLPQSAIWLRVWGPRWAALLVIQSAAAIMLSNEFHAIRFGASIVLILFMALCAAGLVRLLGLTSEVVIVVTLKATFIILLVMAAVSAMGWNPFVEGMTRRPVFMFSEPSYFALIFAPFFLWAALATERSWRGAVFATAIVLLFTIHNLTLLVLVGIAAALVLRGRALVLAFLCLMLVVASRPYYFMSRLFFSIENPNFSALVWMQGWEEAAIDLKSSYGIGRGFQQFGMDGGQGIFAQKIRENLDIYHGIKDGSMNLLDGGTVGAKMLGEFGVVGVFLIVAYLHVVWVCVRCLRRESRDGESISPVDIFFGCCVISYVLDMFVRGVGYFSTPSFFLIVGLLGVVARRDRWWLSQTR